MMGDREIEGGEPAHWRHHDGDRDSMMMRMYFHFGLGDQLLFESFTVDSNYKLVAACLLLCLASILNEAIRQWRTIKCNCQLRRPFKGTTKLSDHDHDHDDGSINDRVRYCCATSTSGSADQDNDSYGQDSTSYRSPRIQPQQQQRHCEFWLLKQETLVFKLIQVTLFTISYSLSLTLMLAAMTFNLCLIFPIVAGAAIGTYLFYRPNYEDGNFDKNRCH